MEARAYDIVIQSERPGNSATLFRLMLGQKLIAKNMTAVQVHILVGEILERLVRPIGARAETRPPPAAI